MPVAAGGVARLRGELIVEKLSDLGVPGVLGDAVDEKICSAAHLNVVEG